MFYTPTGPPSDNKPSHNKLAWLNLIIRCIIFLVLVYGIFLETGICTALFAFFILIGTEIRGRLLRRLLNDVFGLYGLLTMLLSGHPPPGMFEQEYPPDENEGN